MSVETIPLTRLALALIPVAVVVLVLSRWSAGPGRTLHALARMLIQLLSIGYVLAYIFGADSGWVILGVLAVMVLAASWIALNTSKQGRKAVYAASLGAIFVGGGSTLIIVTQGVLQVDPWYRPSTVIPLAGMIFASSMNAISLAIERLQVELGRGQAFEEARATAFQTAMIPVINALFAVGLVSLPGMMTGQILSGVSPFVAARYQIMVMCMVLGASGLSAACFLTWFPAKLRKPA